MRGHSSFQWNTAFQAKETKLGTLYLPNKQQHHSLLHYLISSLGLSYHDFCNLSALNGWVEILMNPFIVWKHCSDCHALHCRFTWTSSHCWQMSTITDSTNGKCCICLLIISTFNRIKTLLVNAWGVRYRPFKWDARPLQIFKLNMFEETSVSSCHIFQNFICECAPWDLKSFIMFFSPQTLLYSYNAIIVKLCQNNWAFWAYMLEGKKSRGFGALKEYISLQPETVLTFITGLVCTTCEYRVYYQMKWNPLCIFK